jgi:hypothetical protein
MQIFKYLSFVIFFLFYSCDEIKKQNPKFLEEKSQENDNQEIETKPEIKPLHELFFLNELIGKYPTQESIFNNENLSNRLKGIDNLDFVNLIVNWNTETALTIEDQIIHASGCNDNDCPSNAYELFIDLENDNINVYHFRGNTLRVYTEKEWINLPKIFNDEIKIKKYDAKIGNINDSESIYNIYPKSYSPHNSNEETAEKISAFLKNILKDDLAAMIEDQREFQYEEVDLNNDGIKEYLVGFKNSYFCGSGGCTYYLMQNNGIIITIFTVAETPFIAMVSSKTNGWRDLLVKSNGSLRQLKFDGKTYPSNPSIEKEFVEIPDDDAYRLLWDEFAIPFFIF